MMNTLLIGAGAFGVVIGVWLLIDALLEFAIGRPCLFAWLADRRRGKRLHQEYLERVLP